MTDEKDEPIRVAEAELASARRHLENAKTRRERARSKAVRGDGRLRPSFAAELQERDHHLSVLEEEVTRAEAKLERAWNDLPRRQEARKKAADLEAEAKRLDDKLAEARAALTRAEEAASAKWAERDRAMSDATRLEVKEAEADAA